MNSRKGPCSPRPLKSKGWRISPGWIRKSQKTRSGSGCWWIVWVHGKPARLHSIIRKGERKRAFQRRRFHSPSFQTWGTSREKRRSNPFRGSWRPEIPGSSTGLGRPAFWGSCFWVRRSFIGIERDAKRRCRAAWRIPPIFVQDGNWKNSTGPGSLKKAATRCSISAFQKS